MKRKALSELTLLDGAVRIFLNTKGTNDHIVSRLSIGGKDAFYHGTGHEHPWY